MTYNEHTMTEEIHHTPVMLQEVLNSLPANPKIVVDWTLWHGWHTSNMLRLFPTIQKLYWFDLDPNIFRETKEKLEPEFGDKILLIIKMILLEILLALILKYPLVYRIYVWKLVLLYYKVLYLLPFFKLLIYYIFLLYLK